MEQNNMVFERTAKMLGDAFKFAHTVGVQTCVGTETPLSKPPNPIVPNGTLPLHTYYSASRGDTFTTTSNCSLCEGLYELVYTEGSLLSTPCPSCVAMSTYYDLPGDNVLLPGNPPPGYKFVRTDGYAMTSPSGNFTQPMYLYFNADLNDHVTTTGPQSEARCKSLGYKLVNSTPLAYCYNLPTATQDYYEGIFTRIMKT